MGEDSTARRAVLTAACFVALAAPQLPAATGARSPSSLHNRAQSLRAENSGLSAQSRAAWLSVASLGTRIEQTQAALVRYRARSQAIARQRAEARLGLRIARRGLAVSQQRLAARLRVLYEQGEADPLTVLLGSGSIDEAITRIDGLHRLARQDRDYVERARAARRTLAAAARNLAAREAEARQVQDATEATLTALVAAHHERAELAVSLAGQRRSNSTRISSLDSQARALAEAEGRAPSVTSAQGHVLTVTATGYSLSGRTATGVLVGYGVVAVDPNVIPLGTRMTIPGYGEGVAADTGGAVSGARIDLWFPTEAEAFGWGTRTVTVTLH